MSSCQVGQCIIRNLPFLQKLAATKSCKRRNLLLEKATPDELLSIVEICFNVLHSNFPLTAQRKTALAKHASIIRSLAQCRSVGRTRSILGQEGGSFPFASLLIPILIEASRML